MSCATAWCDPTPSSNPCKRPYYLRSNYKKVRHREVQLREARVARSPLELTGEVNTPELKTVPAIW